MNRIKRALERTTDTKAILIGKGAINKTAELFRQLFPDGKCVLVIADTNTWRVAGEMVHHVISEAGIPQDEPKILTDQKLHAEWSYVEDLDDILKNTEAIPIAVGSGVINDLTKLCSYHNNRRYIIVATAAAMDGYTSYGASITKDGNKTTFDCPAPLGMILDPTIVANAPTPMAASGYADLIAKIPAGADWILADAVGADHLDEFAFHLVQEGLPTALAHPIKIRKGNVAEVEKLAEGLILSGFAMQAAKTSRPASGLEHQFSHLWDMEGGHASHGFQVGIGTLVSTACFELLLEAPVEELDIESCVSAWKSWEETEADIRKTFGNQEKFVTRGLKETGDKYVDKDGLREQLTRLKTAWPELKEKIAHQIIPFDEVYNCLKAVGAPYEPEQIGISRAQLRDAFLKMPYMRSRYSVIDVAFSCGWLMLWEERLFGPGGRWEL